MPREQIVLLRTVLSAASQSRRFSGLSASPLGRAGNQPRISVAAAPSSRRSRRAARSRAHLCAKQASPSHVGQPTVACMCGDKSRTDPRWGSRPPIRQNRASMFARSLLTAGSMQKSQPERSRCRIHENAELSRPFLRAGDAAAFGAMQSSRRALTMRPAWPLPDKPGHAGPVPPGHRNRANRRKRGRRRGVQNPGFAYVDRSTAGVGSEISDAPLPTMVSGHLGGGGAVDGMEASSDCRLV